jgi:excisionase family DNA binding protein
MSLANVYQQLEETDGRHAGRYYTVAQAARKLQVHRTTILRWIDTGKLRAYRVGPKAVRIMECDLDAVITPARKEKRKGVTRMTEQVQDTTQTRPPKWPLTHEEITRGLEALKRLRAFREEIAARLDGRTFPASEELIREEREERSKRL